MITMPYAAAVAALVAAAAVGATGAAWVICGTLDADRIFVTRAQRWLSRLSHLSRPMLSTMDSALTEASCALVQRGNVVRVRLALRRTERLLRQARRVHAGSHRLHPAADPIQRRFAGRAAGWFPRVVTVTRAEPVRAVAALAASPAVAPVTGTALALVSPAHLPAIDMPAPHPSTVETVIVETAVIEASWVEDDIFVIETSVGAYRPIRTHRRTSSRPAAARPAARPRMPAQRAPRSRVLTGVG